MGTLVSLYPFVMMRILIGHTGLDLPEGCGGSTPSGKTTTPAGEHLQKCSRGRILTPAVNYGDKTSACR